MNDNDTEFSLELDKIEEETAKELEVKNRYKKLSEKVIQEKREKDELAAKAKAEEEARMNAEKERDFFKGFSSNLPKYPQAAEHQDKIWEKVKAGYDAEDAIIAVLAKEGKFAQGQTHTEIAAGGSAGNQITEPKTKTLAEMSADEKLQMLAEAENRGDISV